MFQYARSVFKNKRNIIHVGTCTGLDFRGTGLDFRGTEKSSAVWYLLKCCYQCALQLLIRNFEHSLIKLPPEWRLQKNHDSDGCCSHPNLLSYRQF